LDGRYPKTLVIAQKLLCPTRGLHVLRPNVLPSQLKEGERWPGAGPQDRDSLLSVCMLRKWTVSNCTVAIPWTQQRQPILFYWAARTTKYPCRFSFAWRSSL